MTLLLSSASETGLIDFYTSPDPGSIKNPGSLEDFEVVTVPSIRTTGNSTAAPRHGSEPCAWKARATIVGAKKGFLTSYSAG